MANRLSPEYGKTIGIDRLSSTFQQEDEGFLSDVKNIGSKIGAHFIERFTPSPNTIPEAKRFGELFGKVKRDQATMQEKKEYETLLEKQIKETTQIALGVGPAPLKDITARAVKATGLKQAAEKQYQQALGATTKKFKQVSEKVTPELLKRKVVAFTRGGLESKTHEALAKAGEKFDEVLQRLSGDKKSSTRAIVQTLGEAKNAFTVVENGKRTIIDKVGYGNFDKLQKTIQELGDKVSFETLRKIRQIMDAAVVKGGQAFGRTVSEGSAVDAQREAANAIRRELAKRFPDLAVVNAEYTFWKNAHDIIRATVERTKSQQQPLGETIAETVGAAAGLASSVGKAVTTAVAFKWIKKILTSTGYRTISAVAKNELADAIARGKFGQAMDIVRRAASVGVFKAQSE